MLSLLLLGYALSAALLTAGLNWLSLIPWRRLSEQHWSERARELYPARLGAVQNLLLIPACLVFAHLLATPARTGDWPWVALTAWLGALGGTFAFDREIFPWLTWEKWLHQVIVAWVLRFAFLAIFFGTMAIMPEQFSEARTWIITASFAIVMIALNYGASIQLLRLFRLLHPPPERLAHIVSEVSERLAVSVRRVWLLKNSAAVAYAMPTTRELLFGDRLLELHPDDEIAAICAHELAHLSESRAVLLGRLLGSFTLMPLILLKPVTNTWGVVGFCGLVATVGMLWVFAIRLSRRMEHRADSVAAVSEGDSGSYARALARLYEANQIPAVMTKRQIHPHLYDRMISSGVTPDFPRPEAPEFGALNRIVGLLGFAILFALSLTQNRWNL